MNKNTRQSRKHGFCSMDDMQSNGNKVFSGKECNTAWNNPNSNRRSAHVYKRPAQKAQ